ncbi:ATP-binding cassette domain-containing protein [Virgibacillus oceani]
MGIHIFSGSGEIPSVDGVSLKIHKDEIVGIVGETGSGKNVTSLTIMRLVPSPPGQIVELTEKDKIYDNRRHPYILKHFYLLYLRPALNK